MRRLRMGLLALLLAACSDGATDPDTLAVYNLRTVNGQPLPYVLAQKGEDRLEVWRGSVSLQPNGEFTYGLVLRLHVPDDPGMLPYNPSGMATTEYLLSESGTWVREGQSLRLLVNGMDGLLGVIGDGLTVTQTVRGASSERIEVADYTLLLGYR